ncbi:unnamed protein product [Fusarium graminearum]|nr:unnamed protein product [Fusarium graminearum]
MIKSEKLDKRKRGVEEKKRVRSLLRYLYTFVVRAVYHEDDESHALIPGYGLYSPQIPDLNRVHYTVSALLLI